MARRRQPPGRKRRTREHVIADLGVNHVERVVLHCGYSVERRSQDYGIDLIVDTFDENGDIEVGQIEIQVKASDRIARTANGRHMLHRVLVADMKDWLFEVSPVILVLYDAAQDSACWLDVQEYAQAVDLDMVNSKTIRLQIPETNLWSTEAVRHLRTLKNQIVEQTKRRF